MELAVPTGLEPVTFGLGNSCPGFRTVLHSAPYSPQHLELPSFLMYIVSHRSPCYPLDL